MESGDGRLVVDQVGRDDISRILVVLERSSTHPVTRLIVGDDSSDTRVACSVVGSASLERRSRAFRRAGAWSA